jgi:hypothetical protein
MGKAHVVVLGDTAVLPSKLELPKDWDKWDDKLKLDSKTQQAVDAIARNPEIQADFKKITTRAVAYNAVSESMSPADHEKVRDYASSVMTREYRDAPIYGAPGPIGPNGTPTVIMSKQALPGADIDLDKMATAGDLIATKGKALIENSSEYNSARGDLDEKISKALEKAGLKNTPENVQGVRDALIQDAAQAKEQEAQKNASAQPEIQVPSTQMLAAIKQARDGVALG